MSDENDDKISLDAWERLNDDQEISEAVADYSIKAKLEREQRELEWKEKMYRQAREYFDTVKQETDTREAARKARLILVPLGKFQWNKKDFPENFIKEVQEFIRRKEWSGVLYPFEESDEWIIPAADLMMNIWNASLFDFFLLWTEQQSSLTSKKAYSIVEELSYQIAFEADNPIGELLDAIGVIDDPEQKLRVRQVIFKYHTEFKRVRLPESLWTYYLQDTNRSKK